MASIAQIAEGVAVQLSKITGLRVTDHVPDSINPPAGIVNVVEVTEETFGYGSMGVMLDAVVLTSRASARIGQGTLYEFMAHVGPKSVWLAIAANKDLELGDGTEARVVRYRSLGVEEIAAYGYYGGAFEIQVSTPT